MAVSVCCVRLSCLDCGICASGFVPEKGGMIRWEGKRVAGKGSTGSEGGKTQAT